MTVFLSIDQLSKRRHEAPDRYLFQGITAEVHRGQRVALLGVSGQGKTTLLRIIARLDAMDEGGLSLHGQPADNWKPQEWRAKVSYVAQQAVMLTGSVEDNLRTVSRLHGTPFDRELARTCMEALGLGALAWSKPASELSGGEKQRTALVRTLLARPDVLLLDEVTASLDPGSKRAVEQWLNAWSEREGTACVWITHDLEQAKQVSDRVWFMADGHCWNRAIRRRSSGNRKRNRLVASSSGLRPERMKRMSNAALACTLIFVAVTMVLSIRQKLGLEKEIAIGTIRSAVQLLAIGYVLHFVFDSRHPALIVLLVLMMIGVAHGMPADEPNG